MGSSTSPTEYEMSSSLTGEGADLLRLVSTTDGPTASSPSSLTPASAGYSSLSRNLRKLSKPELVALAKRLEVLRDHNRVIDDMFDAQKLACFPRGPDGKISDYVARLAPRRSGKTEGPIRVGCHICLTRPNSRCVIVYQHRVDAREIAWPIFMDLIEKYGWDVTPNRFDLIIRFANGSQFNMAGADNENRHRQFKGQRNDLVILDECQDWYSDVERLCQWIVPGLADRGGRLFLLGTPGHLPVGYFFEVCNGQHPQWTTSKGNPFENPYTRVQLQKQLDVLVASNPNALDLPWVRREFFGDWVVDERKNVVHIDALNYLYSWHPEPDDSYIISVDFGDDRAAFVVATYNPRRYPWLIYLESTMLSGMIVKDYVAHLKGWMERYPRATIIADPGGMAKALTREIRDVYQIPMVQAVKEDRQAQVELLVSDVTLGVVKIFNRNDPNSPQDTELARQWRQLFG